MRRQRSIWPVLALVVAILATSWAGGSALAAESAHASDAQRQVTLNEEEAELFEQFSRVKGWIEDYSPRDVTLKQLYEGAIKGMLEALGDPYTEYLTPDQYKALTFSLEGEYVGIGVTIDLVDDAIVIVQTFTDSPAERAGLLPGDVILSVDGQDLYGKTTLQASQLIRGPLGTTVTIKVRRPPKNDVVEFCLTRELISPQALAVRDLGNDIGYIKVNQFTSNASREFVTVLSFFRMRSLKGLVLDLRDNPGGLLDSCIEVAEQLVPSGPIVELRRKELREQVVNDQNPPIVPIVVLVNGNSASASEILAGAIRDRGVGILVGQRTFGKASVQTIASLGELGGVRLTIADYYTPSGLSLAGHGLDPDIEVEQEPVQVPNEVAYKRPIRVGTVGLDVLSRQGCLEYLGYEPGEIDGIFGQRTEAALQSFLTHQGLRWEGIAGPDIVVAVNSAVRARASALPDKALDTAIECLKKRLDKGEW